MIYDDIFDPQNDKIKQINGNSEANFISRRIVSKIKGGDRFSSVNELTEYLDGLVAAVDSNRGYFISIIEKKISCDHKYHRGRYYDVRLLMGDWQRKFEHNCKKCGHIETKHGQINEPESTPFPDGFEGSEECYYNNNI